MAALLNTELIQTLRRKRTLRLVIFHAAVLTVLFFLDEPLVKQYHGIYQDVHRSGRQRIMDYTAQAGDSVDLQLKQNSKTVAAEHFELTPRTRVRLTHYEKPTETWVYNLFDILLDNRFWQFFEQFGVVFSAVLVFTFIWEYAPEKRRYLIWFIASLAAAYFLVWFVQHTVGRIRPSRSGYEMTYLPFPEGWTENSSLSFPSGHTTFAFVTATVLAGLFPRLHWFFYTVAALTGISRLVYEAHWLSDVYGGILTGYGSTSLVKTVMPRIEKALRRRLPGALKRGFWPSDYPVLTAGEECPPFMAETAGGEVITPERLAGSETLIVFAPSLRSPATIEGLRKVRSTPRTAHPQADVIVVTPDDRELQLKTARTHGLPFTFVPDTSRKMCRAFKVLSIGRRRPREMTVALGADSLIKRVTSPHISQNSYCERG